MNSISNCFPLGDSALSVEPKKIGAAIGLATIVATVIAPQVFGGYALYVGSVAAITFIATLSSSKSGFLEEIGEMKKALLNNQTIYIGDGRLYQINYISKRLEVERQKGATAEFFKGEPDKEKEVFFDLLQLSMRLGLGGQLYLEVPSFSDYIEFYKSLGMEIDAENDDLAQHWERRVKEGGGGSMIPMKMSAEGLKQYEKHSFAPVKM